MTNGGAVIGRNDWMEYSTISHDAVLDSVIANGIISVTTDSREVFTVHDLGSGKGRMIRRWQRPKVTSASTRACWPSTSTASRRRVRSGCGRSRRPCTSGPRAGGSVMDTPRSDGQYPATSKDVPQSVHPDDYVHEGSASAFVDVILFVPGGSAGRRRYHKPCFVFFRTRK